MKTLDALHAIDQLAIRQARRRQRLWDSFRCSGFTGTWSELLWVNRADFTAFNTSASEGSILAGLNDQPVLPPLFFNPAARNRSLLVYAAGVLSTTGTPTITFQARLGTTAGDTYLSGTSVGVSAAITTANSVTNQQWDLWLRLTCYTPGIGTGNTTLSGIGKVSSETGFATPFNYALQPTTPQSATWTSTINNALAQYLNLSVTWSASSSSNSVTCKSLMVLGLN